MEVAKVCFDKLFIADFSWNWSTFSCVFIGFSQRSFFFLMWSSLFFVLICVVVYKNVYGSVSLQNTLRPRFLTRKRPPNKINTFGGALSRGSNSRWTFYIVFNVFVWSHFELGYAHHPLQRELISIENERNQFRRAGSNPAIEVKNCWWCVGIFGLQFAPDGKTIYTLLTF